MTRYDLSVGAFLDDEVAVEAVRRRIEAVEGVTTTHLVAPAGVVIVPVHLDGGDVDRFLADAYDVDDAFRGDEDDDPVGRFLDDRRDADPIEPGELRALILDAMHAGAARQRARTATVL